MKAWSDVPKAIRTLADRWDVKPVPKGEHLLNHSNVHVYIPMPMVGQILGYPE